MIRVHKLSGKTFSIFTISCRYFILVESYVNVLDISVSHDIDLHLKQ